MQEVGASCRILQRQFSLLAPRDERPPLRAVLPDDDASVGLLGVYYLSAILVLHCTLSSPL